MGKLYLYTLVSVTYLHRLGRRGHLQHVDRGPPSSSARSRAWLRAKSVLPSAVPRRRRLCRQPHRRHTCLAGSVLSTVLQQTSTQTQSRLAVLLTGATNASAYRRYRSSRNRKSPTSLKFSVICNMFVSRCETRIVCTKYSEIGFEVRVSVRQCQG